MNLMEIDLDSAQIRKDGVRIWVSFLASSFCITITRNSYKFLLKERKRYENNNRHVYEK